MARSGIRTALQDVVDHLVDNGISASLDGAQVQWPGVWVWPGAIRPELLNGNGTMLALLQLAVPNTEAGAALDQLDELLGDVLDLFDSEGDVLPQLVQPPGASPLPGLQVTIIISYERTATP